MAEELETTPEGMTQKDATELTMELKMIARTAMQL